MSSPVRNSRRRKLVVGVLIFLGSLMLCVAIFATWVDRVALDSSAWSDTSTKALQQPRAVRACVLGVSGRSAFY